MGVIRAVEKTVCQVLVILKGIETNFEITYNFFILMTINLSKIMNRLVRQNLRKSNKPFIFTYIQV